MVSAAMPSPSDSQGARTYWNQKQASKQHLLVFDQSPFRLKLSPIDLDASTRPPRYLPRDVDGRRSSRRDRRIGASVAGGYRGGCGPERREAPLEAGRAGKLIQTLEGHAPGAAAACMDAVLDKMHGGGGGYSGGPPVSSAAWV